MTASERSAILLKAADLIAARAGGAGLSRCDRSRQADQPGARRNRRRRSTSGATLRRLPVTSMAKATTRSAMARLASFCAKPIGVVSIITPWNFPFLIVGQKLPFALAAGCTTVVKPSELTSGSTAGAGRDSAEAGVPEGVVNIVTGTGPEVGAVMTTHPRRRHGVVHRLDRRRQAHHVECCADAEEGLAGTRRQESADRLPGRRSRRTSSMLPFSAPISMRANAAMPARASSCTSDIAVGGRQAGCRACPSSVKVGDPLDPSTQVGAIITPQHLEKIAGYVEGAKSNGARVALRRRDARSRHGAVHVADDPLRRHARTWPWRAKKFSGRFFPF